VPVKPAADYVHVHRSMVASNRKSGAREPALITRRGRSGKSTRAHAVEILDATGEVAATLVYRPDAPLPCGATAYVVCPYGSRALLTPQTKKPGRKRPVSMCPSA